MAKPDWNKIRAYYESHRISCRKLAEKFGVSENTLEKRAAREGWRENKGDLNRKVAEMTRNKVAERRANVISATIDPALSAAEKIISLAVSTLEDSEQFNRYLVETERRTPVIETVTTASGKMTEKIAYETIKTTEEIITDRVDTQRMKQLADALKCATELSRLLKGILTPSDTERLSIERERLQLEKDKAAKDGDPANRTVRVEWGDGTEELSE